MTIQIAHKLKHIQYSTTSVSLKILLASFRSNFSRRPNNDNKKITITSELLIDVLNFYIISCKSIKTINIRYTSILSYLEISHSDCKGYLICFCFYISDFCNRW